jgi:hydrogenase maturation protein HypF
MAEHDLQGPVIGVSMDGTGYGTDGAIWGGEFLLCEGGKFERKDHLRYVKMLGGDSSMKEGWKSAVSYLHAWENGYGEDGEGIALDLSDIIEFAMKREDRKWPGETLARAALKAGINTITSSSMGRLFDGVSALLGIKDYNDYEGQCAIMLEDAAAFPEKGEANRLALEFHLRVARMILDTCLKIRKETGADQVALTGGVFQNKILMEESLKLLREHGFKPYYNISVSPNDGGIALGQAYIAMKLAAAGEL